MDNARLQNSILEAFSRLTLKEVQDLYELVTAQAGLKGFTYQRSASTIETINLMLVPAFFTEEQVLYLREASTAIKRGIESIYRAWWSDERLAGILPFDEGEGDWIKSVRRRFPASEPVWYRLDSHFHMKEEDWKEKISFFEVNSCAVGGIHYSPVADSLFLDSILPFLKNYLPELPQIRKNPDFRVLLYELMSRHAKLIGRSALNMVFSEDTLESEGITEGPHIVEHLRSMGLNVSLADPRALRVKGGEVYFKDKPVDVIYRNFEIRDLIRMEREGGDTAAIRLAFSKNQVVSSLCGEFDHKSLWEALGSGDFDRYLDPRDLVFFKKHLLWTRTVKECRTLGPEGLSIDLIPFAIKNKDMLVLKPNRLCGGYGVTIGPNTGQGEWERLLEAAWKEKNGWVLQRYGSPEEYTFPLFEEGSLVFDKHNIVYGLSSTPDGTGILGRVSRERVVNVAQRGGLMPVLRAG